MMIFYTHWPCFHQRQLHLSGIPYSSFWLMVCFCSVYMQLLRGCYVLFTLDIFICSIGHRVIKCIIIACVWWKAKQFVLIVDAWLMCKSLRSFDTTVGLFTWFIMMKLKTSFFHNSFLFWNILFFFKIYLQWKNGSIINKRVLCILSVTLGQTWIKLFQDKF